MQTTTENTAFAQSRESAKHERVRTQLLEMITTLARGDRLPPERELSLQFGVSRMTLRQAISALAEAGYVSRVQGSGTFVADPTVSKGTELTGFSEDMIARGFTPSSALLGIDLRSAGAVVGAELGLSPAEQVYHLERVRLADGVPMCIETIDLPAKLVPDLATQRLDSSLYGILFEHYGIRLAEAEQIISATVVDAHQAKLLRIPPHSPALVVHRVGYDRNHVAIERAVSVYRSDRYDVHLSVKRMVD